MTNGSFRPIDSAENDHLVTAVSPSEVGSEGGTGDRDGV
jgi:hypothetical protein